MLFNSFQFIAFFILVCGMYFAIPPRRRWMLLLVASYWFYMSWKAEYAILILASTLVDYAVGLALGNQDRPTARRLLLATSVVANLGVLFAFKYWDFASESISALSRSLALDFQLPGMHLLLPVGISFYTFQSMSYTIDVYRRITEPERHFGRFAVYVAFFPQLVAGPIERSWHLLPQFESRRSIRFADVRHGLQLMLWGSFKKIVIADSIAIVVATVYGQPEDFSGPYLALATFLFAVQIYCDFSGYSDIAIGCARILGYDLMVNFRRPYFAASMTEFWRRWHISLSTWFRDYVYVPLGGRHVGLLRQYVNVMIVFLLSGLWHGAAWHFVAWGFLHGLFLVGERVGAAFQIGTSRLTSSLPAQAVKRLAVFSLVTAAWVFFRASSIDQAVYILTHSWDWSDAGLDTLWRLGLPRFEMAAALGFVFVLVAVDWIQEVQPRLVMRAWSYAPVRWVAYQAALFSIACFGTLGDVEFIYFQF